MHPLLWSRCDADFNTVYKAVGLQIPAIMHHIVHFLFLTITAAPETHGVSLGIVFKYKATSKFGIAQLRGLVIELEHLALQKN